jgi:Cu/Ag efflux protein CusF
MNRTLPRYAYAAGVFLALTMAANAMNATNSGNLPTPGSDNRPLWMAQAQQSEPRKIFSGTGVVTAIEPAGTLTINHEPIEGLMPAMEMMFSVNPRALTKGIRPGDKVEFSVEGKTFTIVGLKVRGHTN